MSRPPRQPRLMETAQLGAEAWLRQRLIDHGALERVPDLKSQVIEVTAGVTTVAMRAERLRRVILRHKLEAMVAGRKGNGKAETYAELFERVYGEALITVAMREAAAALRRRKA